VEKFHADIDETIFDGSNALLCAMANGASIEVIRYLIDHDIDINNQTCLGMVGCAKDITWSKDLGQITPFSGFTPLMMAVNNNDLFTLELLLEAGANPELHTGLLKKEFPVPLSTFMETFKYHRGGYRFSALHIATLLKNEGMIVKLIQNGNAHPDSRVCVRICEWQALGLNLYHRDKHPLEDDESKLQAVELILNTPLHLCEENSEIAKLLIQHGANPLSQNMLSQTTWKRHRGLLDEWLQHKALNLEDTVVVVCKAKNLPSDIALSITEFYVSLHLLDQYERACEQEMSDYRYWPWMAMGLNRDVDKKPYDNEEEEYKVSTWFRLEGELRNVFSLPYPLTSEYYTYIPQQVANELKEAKYTEYRELFQAMRSRFCHLNVFNDFQTESSTRETNHNTNPGIDDCDDACEHPAKRLRLDEQSSV
jgi:hypothetical protein